MSNKTLTLLALTLIASSCTKMGEGRVARPIDVKVSTSDTKSEVTTTHGLEVQGGFVMNAYVDDEYYDYTVNPAEKKGNAGAYIQPTNQNTANVHFHTGIWTIDGNPNWVANIMTRFYCHAPAVMTHADGGTGGTRSNIVHKWDVAGHEDEMSFSYAMPAAGQYNPITNDKIDADNCSDLLFAYADKNYNGHADYINLKFYHALSRVTFSVSTNDGSFDSTLSIKTITVKNVPRSGDCEFKGSTNAFTWSNLGAGANYAQSYNASFSTAPTGWTLGQYTQDAHNYNIYTADNSFFLIPHTLAGAQVSIVFVDNTTSEEIERTVSLPADTWLAGKYYKYKIGATILGRPIKIDVTLDDWTNYDDKLII